MIDFKKIWKSAIFKEFKAPKWLELFFGIIVGITAILYLIEAVFGLSDLFKIIINLFK